MSHLKLSSSKPAAGHRRRLPRAMAILISLFMFAAMVPLAGAQDSGEDAGRNPQTDPGESVPFGAGGHTGGIAAADFGEYEGGSKASALSGANAPDFNGDGDSDIAVFRPSNGTWYNRDTTVLQWGQKGDIPVPTDYNGDNVDEYTVFRPSNGTWYNNTGPILGTAVQWGQKGDIPVPGDYSSTFDDHRPTVFRPSNGTWYNYDGDFPPTQWGQAGDIPVPGNYGFSSADDLAVFRPSNGTWYVKNVDGPGSFAFQWGQKGDIPAPGQLDADNVYDFTVFRPSNGTWYTAFNGGGFASEQWGQAGDYPVLGNYVGAGHLQTTVFRPSNGTWYLLLSGGFAVHWGQNGDIPTPLTPGVQRLLGLS